MEKGTGSQSVPKTFLKFLTLLLLKASGFTFFTEGLLFQWFCKTIVYVLGGHGFDSQIVLSFF